ncbi:hypothetical protein MBORA_06220 [Methanobrevibacter oralis]|uniref:Uncharacterized protein n=1 Tax=Methanobrevibacter oralis TaxID=66851 RepID=A0A166BIF9_METOA|nr:hypothetical protein MBORA_06220 [Methanobrevibacter oralis]
MTKTTNKKKCCQAAEAEPNKAKRILKKIYTFFYGCNCK